MPELRQLNVPEVLEDVPYRAIEERTEFMPQFHDLGPPDMVHLTKTRNKQLYTTYFYTAGVDTLNLATIAHDLMNLVQVFDNKPQAWFGKPRTYRIEKAVLCLFNAFSKVDAHVTIHMPGTTDVQLINAMGQKVPGTDQIWQETYLLAVARCMLTLGEEEEELNHVVETRRVNPFTTPEQVTTFLTAFEQLFWDGPRLGAAFDVQLPLVVNNHLVDTFLKVVELTHLYEPALAVLQRLQEREPQVVLLVARVLLMMDLEVKAIQAMCAGVKRDPRDLWLLVLQASYLLDKNDLDRALAVATQAVRLLPLEFRPWEILTKVYIARNDIDNALLAINSCPMFANNEKYAFRRVVPVNRDNLHLPLPDDATLGSVTGMDAAAVLEEQRTADPQLMLLQAPGLKLTFALAYELLTAVIQRTGWEKLLKARTRVFVMEAEYRVKSTRRNLVLPEAEGAPDEASVAAVRLTNGDADETALPLAAAPAEPLATTDSVEPLLFENKRLCERWLDHLFMVLYDDLKTFTLWQNDMMHYRAQELEYTRLLFEWELLGLTAHRLRHYREASVAFANALHGRFSVKLARRLLRYCEDEKNTIQRADALKPVLQRRSLPKLLAAVNDRIVDFVVQLCVWDHRWYIEFSPTLVAALAGVVLDVGMTKVRSQIEATYSVEGEGVVELVEPLFETMRVFKFSGWEGKE